MEFKFEEALKALEKIVLELEGQDLPLERALERFEEGIRLSRLCHQMLEEAQRRIEILLSQGSDKKVIPWEEKSGEEPEGG